MGEVVVDERSAGLVKEAIIELRTGAHDLVGLADPVLARTSPGMDRDSGRSSAALWGVGQGLRVTVVPHPAWRSSIGARRLIGGAA